MTNPIDHSSPEEEAARQLAKRSEHVSAFPTQEEIDIHHKLTATFKEEPVHHDAGTEAPIKWQPSFRWINSVKINRRDRNSSPPPAAFHFYGHTEGDFYYITGYTGLAWYSRLSNAKLKLSIDTGDKSRLSSVSIHAISTYEFGGRTHRLGSALIQLAVEYSFKMGCGGRVSLNSERESGLFYFKLGFIPEDEEIYKQLRNSERVNGKEMYLPPASIALWKRKIEQCPLLPPALDFSLQSPPLPTQSRVLAPALFPEQNNRDKISEILTELIANIKEKKNNRMTWFNFGIDNKVQRLEAIRSELPKCVDSQTEYQILSNIRDVCSIKRNNIGFFAPHSLVELKKLVHEKQLIYPSPTLKRSSLNI